MSFFVVLTSFIISLHPFSARKERTAQLIAYGPFSKRAFFKSAAIRPAKNSFYGLFISPLPPFCSLSGISCWPPPGRGRPPPKGRSRTPATGPGNSNNLHYYFAFMRGIYCTCLLHQCVVECCVGDLPPIGRDPKSAARLQDIL